MQATSSALLRAGRFGACALLLGAALLAACDNGPKTATSVTLSVPSTNLVVGQHVTITPTVKDADGKVLIGRTIQYTSSAPLVVNVTTEGEVVALSPGSGTITATVEAATANLGIVVAPVPVNRVVVAPDTATFAAATTKQLTATPFDSAGNTLFDRAVSWSVSDASVATVSAAGLVNGIKAGSVVVTATIEGKTGQARLTLTQAAVASIEVSPSSNRIDEGNTFRLTAIARDANGRVIAGPRLNWRSSAPAIATVDTTGLVTGLTQGYTNIIVTSGSAFGAGIVYVAAVVTGSVAITQDSARIDVGATTQLTATVRDTLGSVINKPVTWMSLDNNIATVSSSGLVTGVAVGDVGIVAGREGKADTAIIHVNPPQAASVTISPSAADIGVGRTGRFNATPRDSAGNPLSRTLVWSSGDLAIATIDASTGLITAQATGATTIFAESNGKFATARLTVVATPVATLIPSTTSLVLSPGGTAQVSATVKDAGNNVLNNRLISFSSSGNIIATVDETGVVTGVSPGAATISVSCEGITALIPVVVQ